MRIGGMRVDIVGMMARLGKRFLLLLRPGLLLLFIRGTRREWVGNGYAAGTGTAGPSQG